MSERKHDYEANVRLVESRPDMKLGDVANFFGCHYDTVRKILRTAGCAPRRRGPRPGVEQAPRPHHRASTVNAVLRHKGKLSATAIAAKMGLTRGAVIGIWHRHA